MTRLASIANGATNSYYFGKQGLIPREVTSGLVTREGCTVVLSASGDIGTTSLIGSASFNIRATYAA